jgi:hypothetical protein
VHGGQRETSQSKRNVVDLSQHDGCEGSSTSILMVMVRDGCDGVCACAGPLSSVASFLSKITKLEFGVITFHTVRQ